MIHLELRLVLGTLAAVAVPGITLHFTAGDERLTTGLTAAPFGWPCVLVWHLITALPLGFILAKWVRSTPDLHGLPRWWIVGGLAAICLVLLLGPGCGEAVSVGDVGPVAALILRSLLAVALVFPWCVAALGSSNQRGRLPRPGAVLGLGACFAIVPCGLYVDAVIATQTDLTAELLNRDRLVQARRFVDGLCELGSDRPLLTRPPAQIRQTLVTAIPKLKQTVSRPLPASASPAARIQRAVFLVQLDRLNDAARLLEGLQSTETVQLLLASVYRDQHRWSESDLHYTEALEQAMVRVTTDPQAKGTCLAAIEGLAFNARASNRPANAERVFQQGLVALPSEAAHFHFQLGKHYAEGGLAGRAVAHLQAATALDPARFQAAASKILGQLRISTPACFGPISISMHATR